MPRNTIDILHNKLFAQITLSLLWIIMFAITNPLSNFPLNDDWVHAKSVEFLLQHGEFKLLDFCGSTIIFQVLWGSLFCIFGFSFTALRISIMVLGLIGLLTFYKITLTVAKNKEISFFSTLLMAINPLYFSLSGTFMLDVSFTSLTLLSLYFYIKTIHYKKPKHFLFASIFSIFATLTRQIGLILPFCFIFPFIIKRDIKIKSLLYSISAFILVFTTYKLYLIFLKNNHILPSYFSGSNVILNNLLNKNIYEIFITTWGYALLYIGFFTLPISIIIINKEINLKFGILIAISILLFIISSITNRLPLGNILNNFYLGPTTLTDTFIIGINEQHKIHYLIFDFIKLYGILGVILLFINITQKFNYLKFQKEYANMKIHLTLILYISIYLCFIILANSFFERYLIPVFFIATLAILPTFDLKPKKCQLYLFTLLALPIFAFSLLGHHDYIALNKARWEATDYLTKELNVTPDKIDGGYEFNGWHKYSKDFIDYSGNTEWWSKDEKYIITNGYLPGTKIIKEFPYYSWISLKEQSIKIAEKYSLINYPIAPYIICDAEVISPNKEFLLSNDNRFIIGLYNNMSSEVSKSGNYSIKLSELESTQKLEFNNIRKGDYIATLFWCQADSLNITLDIYIDKWIYKSIKPKVLDSSNNWNLIAYESYFNADIQQGIKLNINNKNNSPIYIDDIRIFKDGINK